MKMQWMRAAAAVLALLLCCSQGVRAEAASPQAEDITRECAIAVSANEAEKYLLYSVRTSGVWTCAPGDTVTVDTPEGKPAQGIMVAFLSGVPALTVEAQGQVIAEYSAGIEIDYIPFSVPASHFVIHIGQGPDTVRFDQLYVFSQGALPDWVQQWQIMDGPCDMMLIATHPDDELLWFGGMIPTYAAEYGKKVMVVYLVGDKAVRRNELLNGLWICGDHYYPEIGRFPDDGINSIANCHLAWGGADAAPAYIVQLIRKYQPKVVVTQDINGEYGHVHHLVTVQAVIDAVTALAADPAYDAASAEQYGVWQPNKLYLHLWKENQSVFDWRQPLSAFGGEIGIFVARRAFQAHVSQQNGRHEVADYGGADCRRFGLYWSNVGPDVNMNDLFENLE